MAVEATHSPGRRLAWLARRLTHLDQPYLITGPQAAYEYHRWLTPLENLVTLQIYAEDAPFWNQMAEEGCHVFETPPTTAQVHAAQEAIILDSALEPKRHQRRRMIDGLAFIAPEDLCLDLLDRARGETSLAEAAAIIIVQRDFLAWDLLLDQAEQRGLARRLGALLDAINAETEKALIPTEAIKELGRLVDTTPPPLEEAIYPPGRHRSVPSLYRPIVDRWGVHLALPRHVIGKVVLDLQPQRS
jgi:hypothetical protein